MGVPACLLVPGGLACERPTRREAGQPEAPTPNAPIAIWQAPAPATAADSPLGRLSVDSSGLPPIARYPPDQTEIESIPVSELDSTWSGARVPPPWDGEPTTFGGRERLAYVHDGDFNGDGVKDRALVGVFKTETGEQGRFLLILTERPGGGWVKAFLATQDAADGFSILRTSDGTDLSWLHCLECDTWSYVVWTGSAYRLEWVSCCDAPEDDSLGSSVSADG